MYRRVILAFLSWNTLLLYAQNVEMPDAAEALCREFFERSDAGRFQDTYELTAPMLKARESMNSWYGRMRTERESMGTVAHRRKAGVTRIREYEGFGSGDYLVAVFETEFSKYLDVKETLVLQSNGDGKLGIVSYRVTYNMWPEAALIIRNGLLIVFFIMSLLATITWIIGKVVKATDAETTSSEAEAKD